VERLEDGEVSGFLCDEVVVGDELEVRGRSGDGSSGRATGRRSWSAAAQVWCRSWPCSASRDVSAERHSSAWLCPLDRPRTSTTPTSSPGPRRRSSTPAARRPRGPIRPAAWSSRTSTAPSVAGQRLCLRVGRIRRCSHVAGRAVWDHRRAHPGRAVRSDLLNHPARFPACRERRAQLTGGQLLHDLETPCLAAPCASGPTR